MCKLWLILIIANSLLIISAYSRVSSSYSTSTSVATLPHPLHKTALHATQLTAEASANNNLKTSKVSLWPCGDDLDKKIMNLAIPALLNFAIVPLVGAADCFWVGRMRNALALSGQGAANQVFNSAFWFLSFLPSVVTPLVAKANGAGDKEAVKDRIGEALFIGSITGLFGTIILTQIPSKALGLVMKSGVAARSYAEPYLQVRGITFAASLLSTVGFAAFRGTFDILTPLKISIISNLINIIADPIFIFRLNLGVTGAAIATCLSEIIALALYLHALVTRNMLNLKKLFRIPSLKALTPLLLGGFSVQLRAIAINIAMLAVTRTTQMLDTSGTTAAAHSISLQLFNLGSVASLALSISSSIIIPSIRAQLLKENAKSQLPAKQAADRLLIWGLLTGITIGALQLLSLPLLNVFTPLVEVQQAARGPSIIGAFLQVLNCIVWTGEGIQQGNEDFLSIAIATMLGTMGMMVSLRYHGSTLVGVWSSFSILASVRLLGVLRHHFFTGPFSKKAMSIDSLQSE